MKLHIFLLIFILLTAGCTGSNDDSQERDINNEQSEIDKIEYKSFSTELVDITVNIFKNGIVEIEEKITADFNGEFSYGFRDIYLSGSQLEFVTKDNVDVTESGKPLNIEISNTIIGKRIGWDFSAINEEKTFILKYKLKNILVAYDDVVDFYYKIWGDGWESSTKKMKITVMIPESNDNSLGWMHPDLDWTITDVDNKNFVFEADNIPKNQWVETRVVFPLELLTSDNHVTVIQGNGLQKIIDEESGCPEFDLSHMIGYTEETGKYSIIIDVLGDKEEEFGEYIIRSVGTMGVAFCEKGNERGENVNYHYCKSIHYEKNIMDDEGNIVDKIEGFVTPVFDITNKDDIRYIETIC